MQFIARKRRHAPAVIIIALIDVLIVVLIFLIVTTTFKQSPAVNIVLPEARHQGQATLAAQSLVVTIEKDGAMHLQRNPVTFETLEAALIQAARENPEATLSINADTAAPVGLVVKAWDAATAARIRSISIFTREGGAR